MFKKIFTLLCLTTFSLYFTQNSAAQTTEKYSFPVDFPPTLAGNFAEVRPDHFHSGIDIKAAKGIGSPIMAAADGYVSRIGVSPTGYGKVIYITHNDGQTTVYGHLDGFKKSIESWVYSRQMALKSFRVDLYPSPSQFAVKQGDLIGYMGNSGSSGGPHLHYEIRDQQGCPINIVQRKIIKPVDKISPNIYKITLYEINDELGAPYFTEKSTIKITKNRGGEWVMSDTILRTAKPFYLAYEVIDYKNGSSNTMGIYSLIQKVNNVEQFSFAIDRISFPTTRYINTFVEYAQNRNAKFHVIRAYVSANNALSIYRNVKNRGIINPPSDTSEIQIETTIIDDADNSSTLSFSVVLDTASQASIALQPNQSVVEWNEDQTIKRDNLTVTFPRRSLYDSAILPFSIDDNGIMTIGEANTALQKPIKVSIQQEVADHLKNKVLLVLENKKSVVPATYSNGVINAELRRMGRFKVDYDTIAPKISSPNINNGKMSWKVSDDLSGVRWYELTVDKEWALGEWDPKSSTMSYKIKTLSNTPKEHKIVLKVSDYNHNTTVVQTKHKW